MLPHEFQGEMNRLEDTFGQRAFPAERAKLIWDHVQDLGIDWFKHIVSNMIGDMRHAPLVKDFREAAVKELSQAHSAAQLASLGDWAGFDCAQAPECLYCGDDGLVETWILPKKIYRKRFRCKCAASKKYMHITQWHRGLESQFELEPWGERVTPEEAKKLRHNWRLLVTNDPKDLEAAIGWQRARSEKEQREIARKLDPRV